MTDTSIRQLSPEENATYVRALVKALAMVPALQDGLALLRPFYDGTAQTAYSDKHSRVGLSPWFFNLPKVEQQATVILHEVMHIMNNHFARADEVGASPELGNIAGDFEINCGLETVPLADISMGIHPRQKGWKPFLSFEQYFDMLKEEGGAGQNKDDSSDPAGSDGDSGGESSGEGDEEGSGSGGSSERDGSGEEGGEGAGGSGQEGSQEGAEGASDGSGGSGQPSGPQGCDEATESRSAAADDAGIEKASSVDETIAKQKVSKAIQEELRKNAARGKSGSGDSFLGQVLERLQPPKVSWSTVLRRIVSREGAAIVTGQSDYSYQKVNRRFVNTEYIMPGMVQYLPSAMAALDVSGSMSKNDFIASLSEIEAVMKAVPAFQGRFTMFAVDTEVKDPQFITSAKDFELRGGGGTAMAPAWRYVASLPKSKRPDVFLLMTDGGIDWRDVELEVRRTKRMFKSIILVTDGDAMKYVVPASIRQVATVLDIS